MNYFGDATGNERSAKASSSRKGKKSNSDKPKQPQRGLGVAQLEKIRLHTQMGYHPNNIHPQMGMGELERSNVAYVQSQPSRDPRWNASNVTFEAEHYAKPGLTMHLFQLEDSLGEKKWSDSMGSSSHNYDSINGGQELDLELRLSL
ncbi:protein SPEAR3-like [Bidens hawaiensis]|uniref:protein SPEAR3-like n=1 Tax=Bidens hawaiensis TaxID=980011 RepID=UPI00404A86CA